MDVHTMEALAKELLLINPQNSSGETKTLLTQLTEAVNGPEDTTSLIGPIMKLLPNHNIQIKKTVHGILPRLCKKHPQTALLAANSVLQDCSDLNPVVKCLGINSLASISELAEHAPNVLLNLLSDGHPRVRLAAVNSCRTFHEHSSLSEYGLVDVLYATVRDTDPQVSTAAVLTLDAVLAEEGGIIVTRAMVKHLLRRLDSFPSAQLASILQALAKYKPKDEKELFEELSVLDSYLAYSSCAAVTVNCICLFITLIREEFSNLIPSLIDRSTPALNEYLIASETDALYVLDFLNSESATPWLSSIPVQRIIPLATDSVTVQTRKLSLIPRACTEKSRSEELLIAVTPWCQDVNCASQSIQCVCQIRAKCPEMASLCLSVLLKLLSSNQAQVTLAAMEGFSLVGLSESEVASLLEKVTDSLDLLQPITLPSILPRLLGNYGELLPSASYLLEHMVNNLQELQVHTRSHLLTAVVKMFLKQPAECQLTLGRLLCECTGSSDPELSARATKYYTLLVNNPQLVRQILLPTTASVHDRKHIN